MYAKKLSRLIGVFSLLASTAALSAQDGAHVFIRATAEDRVGNLLVYHLREEIRKSGGMELVASEDDARFIVHAVTLDPDDAGTRTVYSVVLTTKQFDRDAKIYWTNFVGTCGLNKAAICARDLAAETDKMVTVVNEALFELLKQAIEEEKNKPQPKKRESVNF